MRYNVNRVSFLNIEGVTILSNISNNQIKECVETVREERPLIGSVTSMLTSNFVSRAQNAIGGFSIIVNMSDEAETMIEKANAFYINIGTILPVFEDTIPQAGRILSNSDKTWVLDPIGIGMGSLRTRLLRQFKGYKPTIIKGTPAEILSLANLWSLDGGKACNNLRDQPSLEEATEAAKSIASHTEGVAIITHDDIIITDGEVVYEVEGNSEYLKVTTGAHAVLGGLISTYATNADPLVAALTGTLALKQAAVLAEEKSDGVGTFEMNLVDALYNIKAEDVIKYPYSQSE